MPLSVVRRAAVFLSFLAYVYRYRFAINQYCLIMALEQKKKTIEELVQLADEVYSATGTTNTAQVIGQLFADIINSFSDAIDVQTTIDSLNTALAKKLDAQEGYGLISVSERTRLASVQNYTHPISHPATMILTDSTHRFVKEADITKWNGMQPAMDGYVLISQTERDRLEKVKNYVHPSSHPAAMIKEDKDHRFASEAELLKLAGIAEGATAFSGSYNDLGDLPTIPTSTSELKNDSGFLTEHQDISKKADVIDFSEIIRDTVAIEQVSYSGSLGIICYYEPIHRFVCKVLQLGTSVSKYYLGSLKDPLCGTSPIQGCIYRCDNNVFIGTASGLNEVLDYEITTITL